MEKVILLCTIRTQPATKSLSPPNFFSIFFKKCVRDSICGIPATRDNASQKARGILHQLPVMAFVENPRLSRCCHPLAWVYAEGSAIYSVGVHPNSFLKTLVK